MEYTFPRTGKPPLVAEGELLAEATSKAGDRGYLSQRWHTLTLVRAASGRFVLGIAYRFDRDWGREVPHDYAAVTDDVAQALQDYDPIEHVNGFPPGAQFEKKQQRLLADMQRGYYDACGRLLAQAGIVERV
jgi:hypothetical protein